MYTTLHEGKVSFVNHEKQYISIEYEVNGKNRTINGPVDEKLQNKWKAAGIIKKSHHFHPGDTVSFKIVLSDRGDRMQATEIKFLYNTALELLLNQAKSENNFTGYLKIVDDKYYVKEIGSYLFFPVNLSPWQLKPSDEELNEAVTFALDNPDKKGKLTATLFTEKLIPEYYSAERAFKKQTSVEAKVYKISPHGIYLNIFGDKIRGKIPADGNSLTGKIKEGDLISLKITYLSKTKITVSADL